MIHHPTAPIPQGTCTWQSPAQPLPSSLQSGIPLTACLHIVLIQEILVADLFFLYVASQMFFYGFPILRYDI